MMRTTSALLLSAWLLLTAPPIEAQSLRGSKQSVEKQHAAARNGNYSFLRTSNGVRSFARKGLLVRLKGSSHYKLDDEVSFPYARPEVKKFVERLSSQYYRACGEKLVVTSLTRPISRQPNNASHLSVHPTGMAVDLRKSWHRSCRKFMEATLLALEERKVLEATRELWPPHYHVTIFPDAYLRYLNRGGSSATEKGAQVAAKSSKGTQKVARARKSPGGSFKAGRSKTVRVARGETLWSISQRHGVSVTALKRANGMRSSRVEAGRRLQIPAR